MKRRFSSKLSTSRWKAARGSIRCPYTFPCPRRSQGRRCGICCSPCLQWRYSQARAAICRFATARGTGFPSILRREYRKHPCSRASLASRQAACLFPRRLQLPRFAANRANRRYSASRNRPHRSTSPPRRLMRCVPPRWCISSLSCPQGCHSTSFSANRNRRRRPGTEACRRHSNRASPLPHQGIGRPPLPYRQMSKRANRHPADEPGRTRLPGRREPPLVLSPNPSSDPLLNPKSFRARRSRRSSTADRLHRRRRRHMRA